LYYVDQKGKRTIFGNTETKECSSGYREDLDESTYILCFPVSKTQNLCVTITVEIYRHRSGPRWRRKNVLCIRRNNLIFVDKSAITVTQKVFSATFIPYFNQQIN